MSASNNNNDLRYLELRYNSWIYKIVLYVKWFCMYVLKLKNFQKMEELIVDDIPIF